MLVHGRSPTAAVSPPSPSSCSPMACVVAAANPARGSTTDARAVGPCWTASKGRDRPGRSLVRRRRHLGRRHRERQCEGTGLPRCLRTGDRRSGSVTGRSSRAAPWATRLKPVPLPDGQVDLYIDPGFSIRTSRRTCRPNKRRCSRSPNARPPAPPSVEPAAGPQAWHTIATYNLISGADRIVPPAAQEFMAARSQATVEVIDGASPWCSCRAEPRGEPSSSGRRRRRRLLPTLASDRARRATPACRGKERSYAPKLPRLLPRR